MIYLLPEHTTLFEKQKEKLGLEPMTMQRPALQGHCLAMLFWLSVILLFDIKAPKMLNKQFWN